MAENKPVFIGVDALKEVANKIGTQVMMGPAYHDPEMMARLGIKVISGVQFKKTDHVLYRKGGTTRRKKVGESVSNKIGFLKERVLVAKLSWNHYTDNMDNYVETVFGVASNSNKYPMSTVSVQAILASYAEDLTLNLFFGDVTLEDDEDPEKHKFSLYDGFHTDIRHDMEDGVISESNGNFIKLREAIAAPVDATDATAFDVVQEWYTKWDPRLRQQKKVLVYCDILRGIYISQAYANKYHSNSKVNYLENGNFTIPELPRVEFCPNDAWGVGGQLLATIPDNLVYGVDDLNAKSFVDVRVGSDKDMREIQFQIQSIQGTMISIPFATCFCLSDQTMKNGLVTGDYTNTEVRINKSDEQSTVKVNNQAYTKPIYVPEGTVLTLKAEPHSSKKFVQWSNGKTDAQIQVTAVGNYLSLEAIFGPQG